jgi:hypothetical protein
LEPVFSKVTAHTDGKPILKAIPGLGLHQNAVCRVEALRPKPLALKESF